MEQLFGEGLNWAGAVMIVLLGQQRRSADLLMFEIGFVPLFFLNLSGHFQLWSVNWLLIWCGPVNLLLKGSVVYIEER